jgi:hypothetical protein
LKLPDRRPVGALGSWHEQSLMDIYLALTQMVRYQLK